MGSKAPPPPPPSARLPSTSKLDNNADVGDSKTVTESKVVVTTLLPHIEHRIPVVFQAIANLLDNAVKFSPENGVINVSVERASHEQGDTSGIAISVRDEGPGIDPSLRERVFDRFYRADASRHGQGNGLGLALVKAVSRAHDGSIALSDADPGLEVNLFFAAKEAAG